VSADSAVRRHALLALKILSYNRSFGKRDQRSFVFGIAHDDSDASERAARRLLAAFAQLSRFKVKGMAFRTTLLPFKSADHFAEICRKRGVAALFVAGGFAKEQFVSDIAAVARKQRLPSVTREAAYLKRGIAIALVQDGSRQRILVNLTHAKAQGMALKAELLSLAKVSH
jgi:hypothetical protein